MSFKRAVANMVESFREAMQEGDLVAMREEFSGIVGEGQDPLILQLLGTIAGNLGGKGVDPAKLGVLVAVIANMAREAMEASVGPAAMAATISGSRGARRKSEDIDAPIPSEGKCRIRQSMRTTGGGGAPDGPVLLSDSIYEYEYDLADGHVHLYEVGNEAEFWECTVAVFKQNFVILTDN